MIFRNRKENYMDKVELSPCPFCGGTAKFHLKKTDCEERKVKFFFNVICEKCYLELPETFKVEFFFDYFGDIKISCDEMGKAAKQWNRRS